MNCEQMTLLLSAWLDGEVTAQEEEQMQAHLEQCPECRALWEQLQALHTSFSDLEEILAPESFAQGVMDRVKAESKPKVIPLFKRPQFRAAAGLAACVALFIGFTSVLPRGSSMDAAAPTAMPESAPAAAAYEYALDAQLDETPAESNGTAKSSGAEAPEAPMEPEMEPAAPAPTPTEAAGTGMDSAVMDESQSTESAQEQYETPSIILYELPEGLEEALGELAWEERIADGARCARLTAEQAEKLLKLIDMQGISAEQTVTKNGEAECWTLILQTN